MPDVSTWIASAFGGMVVGTLLALLTEGLYLGRLRRRCWRAERTLAQIRADPEGQALLERLGDAR
jgi:hypothetical protein